MLGKYLLALAIEPGVYRRRHGLKIRWQMKMCMLRLHPVCLALPDTYEYRNNTETSDCINAIKRETKTVP